MNDSALVRSPLKTSGSSPIAFASLARGTGCRLVGRFGLPPSGPPGRPPGGPPGPPPLDPGGPPPPPWNGFHSGGGSSSLLALLNALSKLVASLVSVSELVWVIVAGGSYLRAKCVFQAELGASKGVWIFVGLCLICLLRFF